MAQGHLLGADGAATEGQVSLRAWPSQEFMAHAQVGDAVKTAEIARTEVGPDGAYVLRADPSVPLAAFRSANGKVDLDLWAATADGLTVFSFSRTLLLEAGTSAWADQQAMDSSGAQTTMMDIDLRAREGQHPSEALAPAPVAASEKACYAIVVATYDQRPVVVGEVYPGPHATADFQYRNGSESTTGVGFSWTGVFGSFSSTGTSTLSSTATIDYSTQPANSRTVFRTTFGYQKIHDLYWSYPLGCLDYGYFLRPYEWQGGATQYTAASTPSDQLKCSPVQPLPGSTVTLTKNAGTAITFTNGVSLAGQIGIDLSSKTGFDSSTQIVHTFSSSGSLCGTGNIAWTSAPRIVGK